MRTETKRGWWRRLAEGAISPRGFLLRAALLALAFGVAHAAGMRKYTTILSGTPPTGDPADHAAALWGVLYVLLYFAFVLLAPILVLAAGFFLALKRLVGPGGGSG